MKNKKALFFCRIVIYCIGIVLALIIFSNLFTTYKKTVYVKSNNNNIITFIDLWGNSWKWEATTKEETELKKWEKVTLTLDSNGTDEDTSDDIIKKIEKNQ